MVRLAKGGPAVPLQTSGFNASVTLENLHIYILFFPHFNAYLVRHKSCVLQFSGFLFFTVFLIRSDKSLPVAPDNLPTEMQTPRFNFGSSKAALLMETH